MKRLGFVAIILVLLMIGMKTQFLLIGSADPMFENDKIVNTPQSPSAPKVRAKALHALVDNAAEKPASVAKAASKTTPDGFAARQRSSEDALVLLERKKDEDPASEMADLREPQFDSSESQMLLGRFMDGASRTELVLMKDQARNIEYICFHTPENSFKAAPGTYSLRTDSAGYGVVKFDERLYLRLAWAIEDRRVLYGHFVKSENGVSSILNEFVVGEAAENSLKFCR